MTQGADAQNEITATNARLTELQAQAAENFPLTDDEVGAFFQRLAEQVLVIHDREKAVVKCMQAAIA